MSITEISKLKRQSGASMIEVLVAALVLGIGLLGILSLQSRALQYNQQAYLSSQASLLAQDMAERMAANSGVMNSYLYEGSAGASSGCLSGECTAGELAAWDLSEWEQHIKDNLPSGYGEITQFNGEDGNVKYLVSVYFQLERNSDSAESEGSVKVVVSP